MATRVAKRQRGQRRWWPSNWIRDEAFWRDVTARTLAVLISGAVLYVLALIAGYIQAPNVRHVVIAVAISCVWGLLLFGVDTFIVVRTVPDHLPTTRGIQRTALYVTAITTIAAMTIALLYLL